METLNTTNEHDAYFKPPNCPYCDSTEIDKDCYCNTCGCYTDEVVLPCE